jgi:mycothiol synthase
MEAGFTIRHYVPEQDLSSLSQMLTETESIDRDGEDTSEEYLRSMKEWPNFDPDKNVWIAELNGKFVGYGQILPRPASYTAMYVMVHPSQRRKGLGTTLLSLALDRARETTCDKILIYAVGQNVGSNTFLLHHGFEVIGKSGVMVAPVAELPPVEIPSSYLLRYYPDLRDPVLLTQALDQCYKGMVGHNQNVTSADRYLRYHGEEGIHLLFDEQEKLIGVCAGKPQGKTDKRGVSDLLDAPGFIKEYRQRGFQHFLTLAVMHWLRGKGTRPITLEYWGDDEQAVALYRGLGFELVTEQIAYQRELG